MKHYLIVVLILLVSGALFAGSPLTFEERVKAQEAIERVYYNHRIWPKENPQPKPPFEKMVPKEVIEAKVTDYLKKCSALDQFWQRPIVASQLQAEMDRMAKGSKAPATLNELFAALNNDPYLIAECFARPVLADRLVHNWYANDERFHADTRVKADEALKHLTAENFCNSTDGQYSKMTYRLEIEGREELEEQGPEDNAIGLDEKEFGRMLAETPDEGKISTIKESNDSFVIIHTREKNESQIEIDSLTFEKQSLDEWLKNQNIKADLPAAREESEGLYLPPMPESTCVEGWYNESLEAPDWRSNHSAIWTGSEMIIWGGVSLKTGGRYNPATDTWTATSIGSNCPSKRTAHTAIWNGTEMVIWGGYGSSPTYKNDGARYNPVTDSWIATSTGANCPSARRYHTAVWLNNKMIIWGGYNGSNLNTGGIYDPSTDTWTPTSTGTSCPSARRYHAAAATDSAMIIWGGYDGSNYFNTGGVYNPVSDAWTATSTGTNCPSARDYPSAVWTGTEMVIWGGCGTSPVFKNDGGRYDPSNDTWTPTSTGANCPTARAYHTAVWTNSEMIVWGGYDNVTYQNTGGRYSPSSDTWIATSTGAGCPTGRQFHTAVWNGSEMIVWGGSNGSDSSYYMNSGGRYNPSTDSWVATCEGAGVPAARSNHIAVWTGNEMIVWGGNDVSSFLNTGGRYNPGTDSWTATPTGTNCPSIRGYHTAIWNGSEMIIWGGSDVSNYLNTGGRFNPTSGTWTSTSTQANCPVSRWYHTAIWTGTEMIIWGGQTGSLAYINSGGRYNPVSDSWTATSTGTNCPSGRDQHTAVWTGSEMIVWGGGWSGGEPFNDGGKYNPLTDSWIPTSSTGSPYMRACHTAVWTGSEMIVWGGMYVGALPTPEGDGRRYSPAGNSWTSMATGVARYNHTVVWTGNEMVVWGGYGGVAGSDGLNTGGHYNPSTNSWLATSTDANDPSPRYGHTAIWTGYKMIVWGGMVSYPGLYPYGLTQTGGIYFIPYAPDLSNNGAADVDACADSGVLVSWTAPSNWGDGGSGTRTFDVLRDSTPIAIGLGESTHSYPDTAGNNGASYVYSVRANSGCGLSTTTAGASATDNVAANPAGLSNNTAADNGGCADNGVSISWSIPSIWSDGSSGSRTFDILRDGTPIATGLSESTLSYTDTTGVNGVSYLYQVRANNGCGLSTTTTGMSAADNIGTAPDEVSNFDDVYSWNAVSGADGYRLYRGTLADLPNLMTLTADGCLRYEGTATSYDLSGDDPSEATGNLYWYLVTAYTGVCEGTAGEGTGFLRNLSSSTTCP